MRALAVVLCVVGCTPPASPPPTSQPASSATTDAGTSVDAGAKGISGFESLGAPCPPSPDHVWHARLVFRDPKPNHLRSLRSRLRAPGTLECSPHGETFLDLTTLEARALFGDHIELGGIQGMGNASGACGYTAQIVPPSFVPEALRRDVDHIEIDLDAKFDLVTDVAPCTPM